ncbi:ribosomal RNA small subunit methyltransferase D [Marinicella pacifica]|uniref:Ribosomal RNA small subunit methyltransferase D n=1 Tax=Marinicella pacifica TaxID=1171543 RepID=A0A917FMY3_9GAMM|nr:16S rRNA (guanine(966)-N(2))-methyltransferase RsmD [Marinicella pacifica]GGF94750.1 ribosomal RNA small subunit methyltransferase D [Marinicella pacifica]
MSHHKPGQIRIIGGSHRSRLIVVENQPDLRPTGNRIRETLFNWVGPNIVCMRVLDLFAGSGILGFEALSRGAAHVTFVDNSRNAIKTLKTNAADLNFHSLSIVQSRAEDFVQNCDETFDLIFIDPPFASDAIQRINGIITAATHPGTLIYREFAKNQQPPEPDKQYFSCLKQKSGGQVNYQLWKRHE